MEFVNKATGLRLCIPKRKVKMNVFSIGRLQYCRCLLSWYLAMFQIFCCSIIQLVSFNYHQRNVRSRVSVSVSNFQVSVSVSAFMTKSRSRNLSQVSVSEVRVTTTSLRRCSGKRFDHCLKSRFFHVSGLNTLSGFL